MTTHKETLSGVAKGFAAGLRDDLDSHLNQLGEQSVEVRQRAHALLFLASEVAMLKMAGQNTEMEERALESSAQSLKAAGEMEVVGAVRGFFFDTVTRVFEVALKGLAPA